MGFLKKLVKGVGKVVGKVVKPAVGFAAKLVGGLNIPVISTGANLVGKLVKSIPTQSTSSLKAAGKAATASLGKKVTDVLGDVKKIATSGEWFKKNWYWVLGAPILLIVFIVLLFKRKR